MKKLHKLKAITVLMKMIKFIQKEEHIDNFTYVIGVLLIRGHITAKEYQWMGAVLESHFKSEPLHWPRHTKAGRLNWLKYKVIDLEESLPWYMKWKYEKIVWRD